MKTKILAIIFMMFCFSSYAQNNTFGPKEKLTYEIYYAFVTGAKMSLETKLITENDKQIYHVKAFGKTIGLVDKIYKISEDYQSWFDPNNKCLPSKSLEDVHEGATYNRKITVTFNNENNTINSTKSGEHSVKHDCYDIISAAYYLRTMDLSKLSPNEVINVNTWFGNEEWPLRVKYIKTETIKVGKLGKISCYQFVPVVEVSGVFTDKDALKLWISADDNKIPVRAQMSLLVGSAKVDLISYENLIHDIKFNK
ncbi:MAG: DUF3108 domain-containing protein [Bacteroidales bacterium]|nr:DUF3108 domain-containing protein [Bacteroidales bacterium]